MITITPPTSKKKERQIAEFLKSPLKKGDLISHVDEYGKTQSCRIVKVFSDRVTAVNTQYSHAREEVIQLNEIKHRYQRHVGANPFDPDRYKVRPVQFTLDSILWALDVMENRANDTQFGDVKVMQCNWDPYVYLKDGTKHRYQRPLVWKLANKQALVSSIYNGVDCGKVLAREHDYSDLKKRAEEGETELAYFDIIDGKQRLHTVKEFILGGFKDVHGNYYADLSHEAQDHFLSHQLMSYGVLSDGATDEEVIKQFLKLNFSGIPQSKKHMQYVESLYKQL